jgi:HSP20 family protein
MQALRRWDPFKELEAMERRLETLFGRAPVRKEGEKEEALTVAEWAPLVDIVEDEKEYLVKAELPEVKKEDVHVTLLNDVLTLTGERTLEKEEQGKKFHRVERAYGSFARSFTLPADADPAQVRADFKDGALAVHLPKSAEAKPQAVEVKVG